MFKIQPTIFILAISLISSSQSLAEEPAYNAKTWNEALSIVPCDHVKKNPNGSWAVSATIVIDKERFVDPTIAEKEQAGGHLAKAMRVQTGQPLHDGGWMLSPIIFRAE